MPKSKLKLSKECVKKSKGPNVICLDTYKILRQLESK